MKEDGKKEDSKSAVAAAGKSKDSGSGNKPEVSVTDIDQLIDKMNSLNDGFGMWNQSKILLNTNIFIYNKQ